jgi:hypothetical protein
MVVQAELVLQTAERPVEIRRPAATPRWRARFVQLVPTPHKTPFTFGYLVVLLGTTILLRLVSPALSSALLSVSSTDAVNLWHRPLVALLASAIWLSGATWLPYALIFALAVAPLERQLGGWRTAGIFFSGHVVATLASEVPVMVALKAGLLPRADAHLLDIGVSYGFFTTAGALVFLLAPRWRLAALVLMEAFILAIYLSYEPTSMDSIVTLAGHFTAAQFGLLVWGPWLRRQGVGRRPAAAAA